MTTTTFPVQIDTDLAAASDQQAVAGGRRTLALAEVHRLVGDDPGHVYRGRRRVQLPFALSDDEALAKLRTEGPVNAYDQYRVAGLLERLAGFDAQLADARARIEAGNEAFRAAGGWSRFFLVQGGHIHSSMSCSTCNNGEAMTSFGWLPALSGLTEAEAVAEHGAILCTVCFPSAPVEWTNGRELEAEAKKAAQCAGSGTYDWEKAARDAGEKPRYGRRYQTCPHCRKSTAITSTGKLRAHQPAK
jgi:hypothetical protein